jgi:hypothetical protein
MDKELKRERSPNLTTEEEHLHRRDFLVSLKKWSKVVIGGAILGGALVYPRREASAGWLNRRGGWGGGWINRRGGWGGGSWINRRGGWGGGSWINRR